MPYMKGLWVIGLIFSINIASAQKKIFTLSSAEYKDHFDCGNSIENMQFIDAHRLWIRTEYGQLMYNLSDQRWYASKPGRYNNEMIHATSDMHQLKVFGNTPYLWDTNNLMKTVVHPKKIKQAYIHNEQALVVQSSQRVSYSPIAMDVRLDLNIEVAKDIFATSEQYKFKQVAVNTDHTLLAVSNGRVVIFYNLPARDELAALSDDAQPDSMQSHAFNQGPTDQIKQPWYQCWGQCAKKHAYILLGIAALTGVTYLLYRYRKTIRKITPLNTWRL